MVARVRRVSWSRAEVQALAAKAARGAGAPPAQAAAFGKAAAVHLGSGREPDDLARALSDLPGGAIIAFPLQVAQILHEAWDAGPEVQRIDTRGVLALMHSYLDTLPCECVVTEQNGDVIHVTLDIKAPAAARATTRITGCDVLITRMIALADRTYVPDSDASRSTGAGAGAGDAD